MSESDRREFLRQMTTGAAAAGLGASFQPVEAEAMAQSEPTPRLGPKPVARDKRAGTL